MRRRAWAAAIAIAAGSGTGCSDDGGDDAAQGSASTTSAAETVASDGTAAPGPSVPLSAHGTASLDGAVSATGEYEIQYPLTVGSCESLAQGSSYVIPLPSALPSVRLQWQAALPGLHGPGSYELDDLASLVVTVRGETEDAATVYQAGTDSVASLQLGPDGSGEFTFAGLRGQAGEVLGGTARWTCGPRAGVPPTASP